MPSKTIRPSGQWSNRTSSTPPHFEEEPLVPQQASSIHLRAQAADLTYYYLEIEHTLYASDEASFEADYVHYGLTSQSETVYHSWGSPAATETVTLSHTLLDKADQTVGMSDDSEIEYIEPFTINHLTYSESYTVNHIQTIYTIYPNPNLLTYSESFIVNLLELPNVQNLTYEYLYNTTIYRSIQSGVVVWTTTPVPGAILFYSMEATVDIDCVDLIGGYDPVRFQQSYVLNSFSSSIGFEIDETTIPAPLITLTESDYTNLSYNEAYTVSGIPSSDIIDDIAYLLSGVNFIVDEDFFQVLTPENVNTFTYTGTGDTTGQEEFIVNDTGLTIDIIENVEVLVQEYDYHVEMEGLGDPGFVPGQVIPLGANGAFQIGDEDLVPEVRNIIILQLQDETLSGSETVGLGKFNVLSELLSGINYTFRDFFDEYDIFLTFNEIGLTSSSIDFIIDQTSFGFSIVEPVPFLVNTEFEVESFLDHNFVNPIESITPLPVTELFTVNQTGILSPVTEGLADQILSGIDYTIKDDLITPSSTENVTVLTSGISLTVNEQQVELIFYGHVILSTVEESINIDQSPTSTISLYGVSPIHLSYTEGFYLQDYLAQYGYYLVVATENWTQLSSSKGFIIDQGYFQVLTPQNYNYLSYVEAFTVSLSDVYISVTVNAPLDYYSAATLGTTVSESSTTPSQS